MNKSEQRLNLYMELLNKISLCRTEDELEKVSDEVDECSIARLLTRSQIKSIENELDDQLMTIVEEELYGNSYVNGRRSQD